MKEAVGLFAVVSKAEISAQLVRWADVDKTLAASLAQMGEVAFPDAHDKGQK